MLELDSMMLTQVTTQPGTDWVNDWMPNGEGLLVASEYDDDVWDLYEVGLNGARRRLTCHEAGRRRAASWAP